MQRPDHAVQTASVSSSAWSACGGAGSGRCDAAWVSTKRVRWPASAVNDATVVIALPCSLTSLCSTTWSGPAIARIPLPWFSRVTHGTADPYSKRRARSNRISTEPERPSTMRTMRVLLRPP